MINWKTVQAALAAILGSPNPRRTSKNKTATNHSFRGFTLSFGLIPLLTATLSSQPYGEPDSGQPGDTMIQAFLGDNAQRLHGSFLDGIRSKEDWLEKMPQYKEEYLYMLGLSPLPEKTPLQTTITGTLSGDGYTVDKLHFQSMPGLYVTGNLYRPANYTSEEKLPAILYVCGHGPRGRNGNKTAYQSHGIWYARHGYVCLIVDTLQMGEIAAIHHGTYRENRWWWHSRGYTSAGVECWNGIRGIDYLISRTDVDPERIGVTGRSGGGAATFWIAGVDKRVKAASSVSGMADLPSYVSNRVINGHCDCMFLYNTFGWPWTRIAGLIAPRPLLFVNGDTDSIFPMDANQRIINRLETIYSLFGAGDQVDSVVSIGGHSSREDIRKATYRFMNIHLKNDPRPITDSEVDLVTGPRGREVHPIPPEKLRVFPTNADIPADELNTTIDQHFVPMVDIKVPKQGDFDSWKSQLVGELRRVTFRSFPDRIPAGIPKSSDAFGTMLLETEPGIEIELKNTQQSASINRILLVVNTEEDTVDIHDKNNDAIYICNPRGVGDTRWTTRNPPNYVERSFTLLGRTANDGRIWDIIAAARFLHEKYDGKIPLVIFGKGSGAVLGAYAMLLEPEISQGIFESPIISHMNHDSPPLLNVLRVCDVPDILGSLAPRSLSLSGLDRTAAEKVTQIYRAARVIDNLKINP